MPALAATIGELSPLLHLLLLPFFLLFSTA